MTKKKSGGSVIRHTLGGHQAGRTYVWIIQSRLLLMESVLKKISINDSKLLLDRCIEQGIKPSRIILGDKHGL